jgi:replication factor A1
MQISRRWTHRRWGSGSDRPSRRSTPYGDFLESIVLIAGKYDLDPELLIEAFIEAWSNETSHLGNLKIICREVNQDFTSFLITKGEKVISQFPITTEILENSEYVKSQIQYFPPPYRLQRKRDRKLWKISELSYRMRGIDVKAKIIEIPLAQEVHTRFGTTVSAANVKIADETGSITLSLWNDQIDKVHVGDKIELKNCYIFRYRGALQIRLGRKGTLSIIDEKDAIV